MNLREKVTRALDDSRIQLLDAARAVPTESRFLPQVAADRSVKDILGASVAWENIVLTRIQQLSHDETPDWQEYHDGIEAWVNERMLHKRSLSWTEVLREFYWIREETHVTLSAFDDAFYARAFPFPGPGGRMTIADLLLSIAQRDRQYTAQIKAWWQKQKR